MMILRDRAKFYGFVLQCALHSYSLVLFFQRGVRQRGWFPLFHASQQWNSLVPD